MVGLMDIAGICETVKIGEQSVEVYGVSLAGVIALITKFPELRAIFEGDTDKFTNEKIYEVAPHAVASIIATGCGYINDEAAEEFAAKLPLEIQYKLLSAIGTATMPSGVGPFVARLSELKSFAEGFTQNLDDKTVEAPAQQLPKQSTS